MAATKDYHFKECGLDYVYLRGGVIRHKTPYGDGLSFPEARDLSKVIARHVVTSPAPICGQEVRFMRSVLRLSQTELGRIMGVDRSTVARWEGVPHDAIPVPAANALRLFYAGHDKHSITKQVVELLREQDGASGNQARLVVSFDDGWRCAA